MKSTASFVFIESLALGLAAAALIHAVLNLIRRIRTPDPAFDLRWLTDAGWLLMAAGLLFLWPDALDPLLYPRRALVFFAGLALFPSMLHEQLTSPFWKKMLGVISRAISIAFISFCIFQAIRYVLFVRPWTEGPDFYFYVCSARHMASGLDQLSLIRYFYFPGVYSFWKLALHFTGSNLDLLQWWYVTVVAANAILIAIIIQRVARNIYASVLGAVTYIAFCSRFEGFVGAAESISTVPLLFGIAFWGGNRLSGRPGIWRCIVLGISFGLSVYIRQQAGLLTLGAISWGITYLIQKNKAPYVDLRALVFIPGLAFGVLVAAILCEGYGLQPLFIGLENIPAYGATWSFLQTVRLALHLAWPLFIGCFLAFCMYAANLAIPKWRQNLNKPSVQLMGFCSIAAGISLVQFFTRPHLHYALLAGPMLIIASILLLIELIKTLPLALQQSKVVAFTIVIALLLPFVQINPHKNYFYLWPYKPLVQRPQARPWRLTSGLSNDVEALKKNVQPMENIYVLPPRQGDIHFFLGTRYRVYGWGQPLSLKEEIESYHSNTVILIDSKYMPEYVVQAARKMYDYDQAVLILQNHSFYPAVQTNSLTLWRRRVSEQH